MTPKEKLTEMYPMLTRLIANERDRVLAVKLFQELARAKYRVVHKHSGTEMSARDIETFLDRLFEIDRAQIAAEERLCIQQTIDQLKTLQHDSESEVCQD